MNLKEKVEKGLINTQYVLSTIQNVCEQETQEWQKNKDNWDEHWQEHEVLLGRSEFAEQILMLIKKIGVDNE